MFDTHQYVKTLIAAGEKPEIAEAHAEALIQATENTLATKADIRDLSAEIAETRKDLSTEIAETRKDLNTRIDEMDSRLNTSIKTLEDKFDHKLQITIQRQTIQLGSLIAIATGVLATLMKIF